MKIKKEFQIMKIMNDTLLIDVSNVNNNVIKLNDTSKEIVELLLNNKNKEEIIKYLLDNYNVDYDVLNKDYDNLIDSLKKANVLYD